MPVGLTNVSSPGLPAGVTFTDLESGTVVWTGLNLAPGATLTLTLTGTVDPGLAAGSFTTCATVAVPPGVTDPNGANDTVSDIDAVP
jgi:Domain of unknown function DUF11